MRYIHFLSFIYSFIHNCRDTPGDPSKPGPSESGPSELLVTPVICVKTAERIGLGPGTLAFFNFHKRSATVDTQQYGADVRRRYKG